MKKRTKQIATLLLAMSVLATMGGCGSKSEQDVEEVKESISQSVEEDNQEIADDVIQDDTEEEVEPSDDDIDVEHEDEYDVDEKEEVVEGDKESSDNSGSNTSDKKPSTSTTTKPSTSTSTTTKPSTSTSTTTKPEVTQPVKPSTSTSTTTKPSTSTSTTTKPSTSTSTTTKPSTSTSTTTKPSTSTSTTTKPETTKPSVSTEPETTKPETTKPSVSTEPETTKPETTKPSVSTEPEAPKPEVITWDWKYSGDGSSRVMTSSKGETKGSKEYKYTTNGKVVWGYYADTSSLIGLVNDERAAGVGCDSNGNPLQPTLVGDTLTSVAKNRVLELTQNCSHTGQDTNSEVIGSGQPNAKSAFTAWCYSATHFKTIVNNDYTNAGAAGFWYDSDNKGTMVPYWTIVFNY